MLEGDSTNIRSAGSVVNNWGLEPKTTEGVKTKIGKEKVTNNVTQAVKSLTHPVTDSISPRQKLKVNALKNQLVDADHKLQLCGEILKVVKKTKQLEKSNPAAKIDQKFYEKAERNFNIAKEELKNSKAIYKKALSEHMNGAKKKLERCKQILDFTNSHLEVAKGAEDSKDNQKLLLELSLELRVAEKEYKEAQKEFDTLKKEYEVADKGVVPKQKGDRSKNPSWINKLHKLKKMQQ